MRIETLDLKKLFRSIEAIAGSRKGTMKVTIAQLRAACRSSHKTHL
ncbi:hypothetical protein LR021_00350 [Candidatus Bipolaricaulota bacterium]|nr:hypothetical protein [Candidatus Bipolaricaulota bacterium]